ncbi:hypothetical protein Rsub_08628 [Raphidocelis subcapitata]|uniref:Uncharacterized protein n=1 Tax=Raphidocelis subcapitata TaxID=307507 RepID=A0A2V0P731_9CHLO|nr:hypothetical protein Rsub_08628 [Raphidocelis subcapitata]|eukprot:GBF95646.1 hypothetical protein Rsub_08628 [Raphidocelis subcapitata]
MQASRMAANASASCSGRMHAPLGRRAQAAAAAAAAPRRCSGRGPPARARAVAVRAERKEYYDFKDMPPLPVTVKRITVPELDHTVVDKATEETRLASLAIFYDIWGDDQYGRRLTRKSALTMLCMYDSDDTAGAEARPGDYPNIALLRRVLEEGLDLEFVVEEFGPGA